MRFLLAALALLAVAARGQDTNNNLFHAYASQVNLVEGGRVPIVVVGLGRPAFHAALSGRLRLACGQCATHGVKFDAKAGAVAVI